MKECKGYLSDKLKLYGCRIELSVRPSVIVSAFSKHYQGSAFDLYIMQERLEDHRPRLEMRDNEEELDENFYIGVF